MPEVHVTLDPIAVYAIVAVIGACALLALVAGLASGRRIPVVEAVSEDAGSIVPQETRAPEAAVGPSVAPPAAGPAPAFTAPAAAAETLPAAPTPTPPVARPPMPAPWSTLPPRPDHD